MTGLKIDKRDVRNVSRSANVALREHKRALTDVKCRPEQEQYDVLAAANNELAVMKIEVQCTLNAAERAGVVEGVMNLRGILDEIVRALATEKRVLEEISKYKLDIEISFIDIKPHGNIKTNQFSKWPHFLNHKVLIA